MTFVISDLVGICFVVVSDSLPQMEKWKATSPIHFYVKYKFPSLNVLSWNEKMTMRPHELSICKRCLKPNVENFRKLQDFKNESPLRVFDPFSGVGAFPLAMEESGCFKLTHAIEISPSAAQTLKYTFCLIFFLVFTMPSSIETILRKGLKFITNVATEYSAKPFWFMRTKCQTN